MHQSITGTLNNTEIGKKEKENEKKEYSSTKQACLNYRHTQTHTKAKDFSSRIVDHLWLFLNAL